MIWWYRNLFFLEQLSSSVSITQNMEQHAELQVSRSLQVKHNQPVEMKRNRRNPGRKFIPQKKKRKLNLQLVPSLGGPSLIHSRFDVGFTAKCFNPKYKWSASTAFSNLLAVVIVVIVSETSFHFIDNSRHVCHFSTSSTECLWVNMWPIWFVRCRREKDGRPKLVEKWGQS